MKGKVLFQQQFEEDQPLFALSFHPERNLYATGFATGHVTVQSYDTDKLDDPITKQWSTKRHKSSCRGLQFDQDGTHLYSMGTDKVVKRADTETGKVVGKNTEALKTADPTAMVVNESFVVVGDEDSNLSVFDNRTMKRVYYFENLHIDSMSSIVDLPFKNKYHFLTTGGTTLAHLDIRKGDRAVLSTSDEQEDELMSGCVASEKYSVFGITEGYVTIWDNSKLQDQMNRMRVSDESVDSVIAGEEDNIVYTGAADGVVKKLDVKASRKEPVEFVHSRTEEVTMLDFDYEYHLASAGMERLKLWQKEDDQDDSDKEGDEDDSDSDEEENKKRKKKKSKNPRGKKHKHGIAQFADL